MEVPRSSPYPSQACIHDTVPIATCGFDTYGLFLRHNNSRLSNGYTTYMVLVARGFATGYRLRSADLEATGQFSDTLAILLSNLSAAVATDVVFPSSCTVSYCNQRTFLIETSI